MSNEPISDLRVDAVSEVEEYEAERYTGHFGVTVFFYTREEAQAFADGMVSREERLARAGITYRARRLSQGRLVATRCKPSRP